MSERETYRDIKRDRSDDAERLISWMQKWVDEIKKLLRGNRGEISFSLPSFSSFFFYIERILGRK